jgi:uncharacterized protein with FMN-binding domain
MKNHLYTAARSTCGVLAISALLSCAPKDVEPMPQATSSQSTIYKDGTYTATGEYGGLPSHLTVTVSLKGDLLTEVHVKTLATDPTSLEYQRAFAEAVPKVVQGKRLRDVKVGKLAGASGCPIGFNDALAQIKKQAAKG